MGGLNPESWPILGAFLVLQTLITIPLVRYIRAAHEAQIALLKDINAGAIAERERLLKQVEAGAERMWRLADAIEEMRGAVREISAAIRELSREHRK